MKNIIIATLAFFAVSPSLAGEPSFNAPVPVVQLANPSHDISQLRYLSDGQLVAILRQSKESVTMEVSAANRANIEAAVRVLADAQTVERYAQIVCMMMPGPRMILSVSGFDAEAEVFSGNLRIIKKAGGCAFHDHLNLADANAQKTAEKLEAILQTLASEAVSE